MQTARNLARTALIVAATLPLTSCGYLEQLSAMRTFKEANALYNRGDYDEAIAEYQHVLDIVADAPDSELAQRMSVAYFFMGNSYDSLYKPAMRGEPENDELLTHAEQYYQRGADEIPGALYADYKKLSLQYLVALYGPDKLNSPNNRARLLQEMIRLEPDNTENYFALAQLYEESGLFEDAEMVMLEARNLRPDDPGSYLQLAGFYNRSGDFEQTIEALRERARVEPDNPEAYYTISTFYWEKAFRDFRITQEEKAEYVMAGLEAADQAIALNDRYVDALVYKNILLRMQANMTEDRDEQEALIAEADELRDLAQQIQDEARGTATGAAGE